MADTTAIDDGSSGVSSFSLVPVDHDPFNNNQPFSLVPVDHDPFAAGSIANPQTSPSNNGLGAPNSQFQLSPLGNPVQSVSPNDAVQALKLGQPMLGLGNDPTTALSLSFMGANPQGKLVAGNYGDYSLVPVDHDPFAAGSIAQPQVSSSDSGFGASSSQFQLSPLGGAGQSASPDDVMQALRYGQPFAPHPSGSLSAGQASAPDNQIGALSPDGPIPKPGQTIPTDNPIGAYNAARLQISHALFPGLTDYLTKPPAPPSLLANAQGKLPSTDNPYAIPALIDVGATLGPLIAEKLGGTVASVLARGAPTLTRPPVAPNLLADAYHYTFEKFLDSIKNEGLNPGTYATTSGQLSPLQTQIDLALPSNRGLTNSVLRIDLDAMREAGKKIPPVTTVAREYGMPGGGTEMEFPDGIGPQYIQVVPK